MKVSLKHLQNIPVYADINTYGKILKLTAPWPHNKTNHWTIRNIALAKVGDLLRVWFGDNHITTKRVTKCNEGLPFCFPSVLILCFFP